mgnify:CR=1 FL=1|tara:strand:+ start:8650 stop:9159 length:510 start_codon:yes stop_codon:yes gene_type:complete
MAVKAFPPPDKILIQETKNGRTELHPRWTTFFARLSGNSNRTIDLEGEVVDAIFAQLFPAVTSLRGRLSKVWGYLFERPMQSKSTAYTLQQIDAGVVTNTTGGAVTITLPDARKVKNRKYTVQKFDSSANAVTVATTSAQTINGDSTLVISYQDSAATILSDGSNWIVA